LTPGWTQEELAAIGKAEELEIAPARADGSLRRATPIWVVRVGDDLYVRSFRGHESRWFRAAQQSHEGEISAAGVRKHVDFVDSDDAGTAAAIDEAYHAKYQRYGARYVDAMVADAARATTLRLVPSRDDG
jgi:hypothetical protein